MTVKEIYRTLELTIRFFTAKRVMTQASALTYSSLLAIVPILAVIFAIARGFGYNKYIEIWFRDALSSQPQVADVLAGFVNSYLIHTQSGIFLGVGLLFMLYTVLMLVNNVEETFNQIWQVNNSRPIIRSLTNYLAMFFVFPIIIVVSMGLSIFMATIANKMGNLMILGTAMRILFDFSPYLLLSLLFIWLYVYMPNTDVKLKSAIVPGILAGIAMQLLQLFYIHSQIWVTGYNAIYGSFAALPLFMLWIQISWTICLFGAQLTYTNQNKNSFGINLDIIDIHPKIEMTEEERTNTDFYAGNIDSL
jgi:membrane protein